MQVPTIESVMIRDPITITADTRLGEALEMMMQRNLRHLPVMNGGELLGVASDRDVLLAEIAHVDLSDHSSLKIGDVCALDAYCVAPETPLPEVLRGMAERHIGSALVCKDDGRPLGIFTSTDACRQLAQVLEGDAA